MASQYSKRKAKSSTQMDEVVETKYDRMAYDVFYDETERKYIRVSVEYDSSTGQAVVKERKAIADSQPVAVLKMTELINRIIFKLPHN